MFMARDGASACVVTELAMNSDPPDFTSQMLPLWVCATTLNIILILRIPPGMF